MTSWPTVAALIAFAIGALLVLLAPGLDPKVSPFLLFTGLALFSAGHMR